MLIYEVLKQDHDLVKDLLSKLLALDDSEEETRAAYIQQIRDELIPHSRAEESVFYNSLRSIEAAKAMAMHAYKEHMEIEGFLRLLQIQDKADVEWRETAQKLKSTLEHHISEEENTMFNVAKNFFTNDEAEMMARSFESLKPEIRQQGILKTTWDMVGNMMPPRFRNTFQDANRNPRH